MVTFAMIKAKFRVYVRSRTGVAIVNELLCKLLCHNLCVLIQEQEELGITAEFWSEGFTEERAIIRFPVR
jgi:hypothetical protein